MKKTIFTALVITQVFLSVSVYAQNVVDFDLDLDVLLGQLADNEALQYFQNYRNRTIRTFGRISSISGSGTEIVVAGFDAPRALRVYFNGSERSKILNLNEGQLITFSGVYTQEVNAWGSATIGIKSAVLEPNTAEAYFFNGRYLAEKRGDYDRAIADFTQAVRLDPKDKGSFYYRGASYHMKGDYARAISDYEAALRLDPNYADTKRLLELARRRTPLR
jgi:tetratricopeptide (TPR) repeat protein